MTDLSIIIVNYNDEKFLKDCLSSVYNETPHISLEIIFVDNNSSDNSVELVKREFPKVKIIRNKENLGFCKANNQGLRIFQGRYALLLNTDTIVKDRALEKMVGFMDANPKIGICGPKLLNPDGSPQHQGGLFNRRFWLSKKAIKVGYMIGACLMARREVVDKVGGLDENFFFSNDDLDWCKRIRKTGWKIVFYPEAKVTHYGGYSSTRVFNKKLFIEGFTGGLYFCRKHYGMLAFLIYRILLPIGLILLMLTWLASFPFKSKEKKIEYPQKFASLWEILKIDLLGQIIPPKAI